MADTEPTEPVTEPPATEPSAEALKVAKADAKWRSENPSKPRQREANPAVGGESFTYLD